MSIYLYTFSTVPKVLDIPGYGKSEVYNLKFSHANWNPDESRSQRAMDRAQERWFWRDLPDHLPAHVEGTSLGEIQFYSEDFGDESLLYKVETPLTDASWVDTEKIPGNATAIATIQKRGNRWIAERLSM